MALQRLKEAGEQAKKDLSKVAETTIKLPFITAIKSTPKHIDLTLTQPVRADGRSPDRALPRAGRECPSRRGLRPAISMRLSWSAA